MEQLAVQQLQLRMEAAGMQRCSPACSREKLIGEYTAGTVHGSPSRPRTAAASSPESR